ncbi:hypothetical protein C922_05069 [Plasmodium inui San Antonio 1]|uniref:Uncharacterized protein n=1 Tax=Plasmodium inui San Antonio 1 TaxID=1237626 RepID=W6ZZ21_9APIC|nr:hypothetical protein C922_05069 [Plasmodium inui San Antonio 1]EUD64553.1 hypothetical protein C922_05069 [Plasmodium inui San Antonio 1]
MADAVNSTWELSHWEQKSLKNGYLPKEDPECKGSSSSKYCYSNLLKKGESSWGQLSGWMNSKLLTSNSDLWGNKFNPGAGTKLKAADGKSWDWGGIVHKVMQKIQDNLLVRNEDPKGSRLWGKQDWYEVLGTEHNQNSRWDKSQRARQVLMVIVCIITGLTHSDTTAGLRYPRREELCERVDRGLMVREEHWDRWKSSGGKVSEGRKCESKGEGHYENCEDASLSLIATVYDGLSQLCTDCGPYSMNQWIELSKDPPRRGGRRYCKLTQGILECEKERKEGVSEPVLWIDPLGALAEGAKIKADVGRERAQLDSRSEDSSVKQGAPMLDGKCTNNHLLGCKPSDNGHASSKAQKYTSHRSTDNEGSRGQVSVEPKSSPNGAAKGATQSERVPSADLSGRQTKAVSVELSRKKDGSRESATSNKDTHLTISNPASDLSPQAEERGLTIPGGLGTLIGGILSILLLGGAAAYGIFRIWGRPRRKDKRKEAFGRKDKVCYGMGGAAGEGRINISVIPFPA